MKSFVTVLLVVLAPGSSVASYAEQCQTLLNTKENGKYKYWQGALSSTLKDFREAKHDIEEFYFQKFAEETKANGTLFRTRCLEEVAELTALNEKSFKKKFVASSSGLCLEVLSDYCNRAPILGNMQGGDSLFWRTRLRRAMGSGHFNADVCHPSEWLGKQEKANQIPKGGVILDQTTVEPITQVVIKCQNDYRGDNDNGLEIERGFYRNYIDMVFNHGFTPNFVAYYGDYTCSKNNLREHANQTAFGTLLQEMNFRSDTKPQLQFLITERSLGESLGSRLYKNVYESAPPFTEDDWRHILFQIIYSFEVFNRLGMRHNDAHLQNIFVEIKESPFTAIYALDKDHVFKLTTDKMVKIFDLDRASATCDRTLFHPSYAGLIDSLEAGHLCLSTETKLGGVISKFGGGSGLYEGPCFSAGRCNDRNIYYDTHLALQRIYNANWGVTESALPRAKRSNGYAREMIRRFISKRLRNWQFLSLRHVQHIQPGKEADVKASYVPKDDEMKTPLAMLLDDTFRPMRIDPNQIAAQCEQVPIYHLPLTAEQPIDYWNPVIPEKCLGGVPEPSYR